MTKIGRRGTPDFGEIGCVLEAALAAFAVIRRESYLWCRATVNTSSMADGQKPYFAADSNSHCRPEAAGATIPSSSRLLAENLQERRVERHYPPRGDLPTRLSPGDDQGRFFIKFATVQNRCR